MTERIFNFSAGPAMLPVPVLETARDEMLSFRGSGMSVMEISHRSEAFGEVLAQAQSGLRRLMSVPDHYKILFLQGGATLQFSMVPLNFLQPGGSADYIVTGAWGKKAVAAAQKCGDPRIIFTSEAGGFRTTPDPAELKFSPQACYVHYTSNETIEGVEFPDDIDCGGVPVVCDASSNILSRPIDINKYALIYAGAQKNIGPSGVTIVIIKDEMLNYVPAGQHSVLDYRNFAEHDSMPNTPNTWGIYVISLVTKWLLDEGGLTKIAQVNSEKAALLYKAIESSDGFYRGHANEGSRSRMNVTFHLPTAELDDRFCAEASAQGLNGLKGHRSLRGIRASIYNAFPTEGVTALVDFMGDFSRRNG